MNSTIFATAYLPPVSYVSALLSAERPMIEVCEHWVKQSYRNRCRIVTSTGLQDLIIPVQKMSDKTPVKDVRISYDKPWIDLHLKAMESAYGVSPYFEYYIDDLMSVYDKKYERLCDFNSAILSMVLTLAGIDKKIDTTDKFMRDESDVEYMVDTFHPKKVGTQCKEYYQVFSSRNGFINDASIADLLFNVGTEMPLYFM